jgi:carboxyl-terminal processing protease
MKRFILVLLSLAILAFTAKAQTTSPVTPPVNSALSGEGAGSVHLQTFEIVWRTVKEKHFDPNYGGVNWDQVRERYAPKVAGIKSDQELYRLLQQMLGELRQSHFNIIPPEAITPDDGQGPSAGSIGIDLRLIDHQAVITGVEPGSRAYAAGLRPGFVIEKIGEKTVEEITEPIIKLDEPQPRKNLLMTRRLFAQVNGTPESPVKISYLDGNDRPHAVTVTREKRKGELSPPFGNFPPQYTEFESKHLPGNIGYIRFNIFTVPVMSKVRDAIRELSDTAGMIFDLRGNPGGVGGMASGIAGLLTTRQGSLGTMKLRTSQLNFSFFPQANPYNNPVVILIDGGSGSTSEIFAGGLQEIGRAVVVGERSVGAALPSYFQKLPTGAIFQFAIADFKTPKGILIEGRGVIPDLEIKWDRKDLLAGRDAQLEKGIEQLLKNKSAVK